MLTYPAKIHLRLDMKAELKMCWMNRLVAKNKTCSEINLPYGILSNMNYHGVELRPPLHLPAGHVCRRIAVVKSHA